MTDRIFIAATGQHVGKTTLSLGLFALLQKKFGEIAFFKPVGQKTVVCSDGRLFDKDVDLFQRAFQLKEDPETMNPIVVSPGMTKEFIQQGLPHHFHERINQSFDKLRKKSRFVVVEGTGHVGVGSVLGMSNATVAKLLECPVLLVAKGGIGSTFDEIVLNVSLLQEKSVPIKGVIVNQVLHEKREEIESLLAQALPRIGVPFLGSLPYEPSLKIASMHDFVEIFDTPLISGHDALFYPFPVSRLVAGSLEAFLSENHSNQLLITPACRIDIIDAVLDAYSQRATQCGMIWTGKIPPSEEIVEKFQKTTIPVVYVPHCSFDVMQKLVTHVTKTSADDQAKTARVINFVQEYINHDLF